MSEHPQTALIDGVGAPEKQPDELQVWVSLLQEAAGAGSDMARLLQLELRIAVGSVARMVPLLLLLLPLSLLLWIGTSVTVSWLAYQFTGAVAVGLVTFAAIQLLAMALIFIALNSYRKTLSLPMTRKQLRAFAGAASGEPKKTHP